MSDWLLADVEILEALDNLIKSPVILKKPERAIAKAQAKKLVEKFEEAGIYTVNKDGVYFWNPQKFRAFWEALKKEVEDG